MMTDDDRWLVQTSWACIAPIAPQAAEMFYDRLFALDPGLKPLFVKRDMRAQKLALVQALSVAVAGLDDIDSLMPVLRDLGARHASYGVRDRHYAVVGQALIWTLERGLGPDATPDVLEAWAAAYAFISAQMITGATKAA